MARRIGVLLGFVFLANTAAAQLVQQGSKLVGTGAVGPVGADRGSSVAISADGNTAIVGGPWDNNLAGATWVFTRAGGVWSQQGDKLVGAGALGGPTVAGATQGTSVAISADGNTAIVGGPLDNNDAGAAWVFTRSGAVWSQQGSKLVGTGAVGATSQGASVAISADGNTAIVGGPSDNASAGAAWVFTRSGGVWSQQGDKLVGAGAVGGAWQGSSVAISADGNTAIVGGPFDDDRAGAMWVFTRSGGVWSQQGGKLAATGGAEQGSSVAISADGNTAIVGGPFDNNYAGAAWVYTRSGGMWTQQGDKLVGTGAVGAAYQGHSVAISADGNSAIVGGPGDNTVGFQGPAVGAAWVFTRRGGVWSQQGDKLVGTGVDGGPSQGSSVAISADGTTAIVGGPYDHGVGLGPAGRAGWGAAWIFAGPFSRWVPVAAHNAGLNGSQWRSDLGLLNTGTVTANAEITLFGSDGTLSSTTSVPAGAQATLTDLVGQLGGSGQGALQVLSDQPLTVTSRTYNKVSSGASCYANGTQGQDYPAVASGSGLLSGQSAYLAGLVENASFRSNIGLVNTGPGAAAVLVELYDGDGTKLADYTVTLNPGEWKQETQPFFTKAGQTAMDRGYARITVQSGSGVFAFASVVDNLTNDPTTIIAGNPVPPPIWVPVAARNPGLNGSQWRSDLGVLNTGTGTANVQVEFFGSGGVVSNTTYVPAGAQSILTDVVGQLGVSGQGALEVLSDQPLVVTSRTYNQVSSDASCDPNGTQGQDYPVLVTSDGLSAGQIAYLAGLTENASYRSNIGLVNTGPDAATVLVELYDGHGSKLTEYTVALELNQWSQAVQPFRKLAGETALDSGYAQITVQTGSGVFGFASVVDNLTNDPTTVTMQR